MSDPATGLTFGRNVLSFEELLERIRDRTAPIAVVGLGQVGLPLAQAFADTGFRVLGIDVDPARVAAAGDGLEAGTDPRLLAEAEVVVVCVPTPLGPRNQPDLSAIHAASRAIARHLIPGALVVLESTTFPGTTGGHVRPILEEAGLVEGEDFLLAYSPARDDPGHPDRAGTRIPRVVGADTSPALVLAEALFGQVAPATVPVSSLQVAEAVKLTENVYRAVNIALANELKIIFDGLGIDVWEVMDAAATKPFGFQAFHPGPGLGGHCIPVDPHYLGWLARQSGLPARMIELAGRINAAMPGYVADRLAAALGGELTGARVLVLGVAYKEGVADARNSPGMALLELLRRRGARPCFFDPRVTDVDGWERVPLEADRLLGLDAAILCNDDEGVDYELLLRCCPLVVDTRNAYGRRGIAHARIVKA